MTGRNQPCPCGSGKRYKHCCGALSLRDGQRGPDGAGSPDMTTKRALLEQATRAGDASAAASLGLITLTGEGAPPNPARGLMLIEQAAAGGDARGAALAATVASCSFWRTRNWELALDHLLNAASRGHGPSQGALRILAGGPHGADSEGCDWAAMRTHLDLEAWLTPPAPTLARTAPRIQIVENFAPPTACQWLINQARDRLRRATIYDSVTGGDVEDARRLNSQCDLGVDHCGVLTFILRARLAAIIARPDQAMEVPKVLHYAPGEAFTEHCDYLEPTIPSYAAELATRGQRTETFLIYLNDDFTGGETWFPELDFSYRGNTGDALLFANVTGDGEPDPTTRHAGLPPTTGEKWVFSQWIRGLPHPGTSGP